MALPDRPAAPEEADHHDDDPHDDEGVRPRVQELERFGALNVLFEVLVHSHPDPDSEQGTSHQLGSNKRMIRIVGNTFLTQYQGWGQIYVAKLQKHFVSLWPNTNMTTLFGLSYCQLQIKM